MTYSQFNLYSMRTYIRWFPLSLVTIVCALVSLIFPVGGNPVMMLLGSYNIIRVGLGTNDWLLYILIGVLVGQLAQMIRFGFMFTDFNMFCAIFSLIMGLLGGAIASRKNRKKV